MHKEVKRAGPPTPRSVPRGRIQIVTIRVPDGYETADAFLKDCGFERPGASGMLADRCKNFLDRPAADTDVEDMVAFVQSEIGRAADPSLEDTLPIVLYFADEEGRAAMVDLMKVFKPGMVERKWPR